MQVYHGSGQFYFGGVYPALFIKSEVPQTQFIHQKLITITYKQSAWNILADKIPAYHICIRFERGHSPMIVSWLWSCMRYCTIFNRVIGDRNSTELENSPDHQLFGQLKLIVFPKTKLTARLCISEPLHCTPAAPPHRDVKSMSHRHLSGCLCYLWLILLTKSNWDKGLDK